LVDGTAEFTYVLTDFLPAGSISVRGELKSPNIIAALFLLAVPHLYFLPI